MLTSVLRLCSVFPLSTLENRKNVLQQRLVILIRPQESTLEWAIVHTPFPETPHRFIQSASPVTTCVI